MPDMSRRDWLTGVVTSVVGAQLAIAAQRSVEGIIMPDTEIKLYQPADVPTADLMSDVYVKNADGDFMPIGYIRSISVSFEHPMTVDVTGYMGNARRFYSADQPNSVRIEGDICLFSGKRVPTRLDIPVGRGMRRG
jgi:hypothetical protein